MVVLPRCTVGLIPADSSLPEFMLRCNRDGGALYLVGCRANFRENCSTPLTVGGLDDILPKFQMRSDAEWRTPQITLGRNRRHVGTSKSNRHPDHRPDRWLARRQDHEG